MGRRPLVYRGLAAIAAAGTCTIAANQAGNAIYAPAQQVTRSFAVLGNCQLDVDGNGMVDPLTDGLLILRAMFKLTGNGVTGGAVGNNATRDTWALLQPYLNRNCWSSFAP